MALLSVGTPMLFMGAECGDTELYPLQRLPLAPHRFAGRSRRRRLTPDSPSSIFPIIPLYLTLLTCEFTSHKRVCHAHEQ
jgi:hypothetical protein